MFSRKSDIIYDVLNIRALKGTWPVCARPPPSCVAMQPAHACLNSPAPCTSGSYRHNYLNPYRR